MEIITTLEITVIEVEGEVIVAVVAVVTEVAVIITAITTVTMAKAMETDNQVKILLTVGQFLSRAMNALKASCFPPQKIALLAFTSTDTKISLYKPVVALMVSVLLLWIRYYFLIF